MSVRLESPPPSDEGFYRSLHEKGDDHLDAAIPSEDAEGVTRRNFLGLGLVGVSAMGLAACLKDPREKLLPYTRKPEDVTPGVPLHYATAMTLHGVATALLVTTYEGRPTKIEGNPGHPASLGAAGVHEQALLQSLYDPHRAQSIKHRGEPLSRADLFKEIEVLADERWAVVAYVRALQLSQAATLAHVSPDVRRKLEATP
jgi:anaerobic selenocysteine-containing dehydrogenase